MSRMTCIWLDNWPIDRLRRSRAQRLRVETSAPSAAPESAGEASGELRPFALTESGPRGVLVVAATPAAMAQGVSAGLRLADARARCPALVVEPVDRDADRRALARILAWCRRYAPGVSACAADALMLDTTGCAHLFGGEKEMAADMARRFAAAGVSARIGMADTQGAAFALAHYAPASPAIAAPGDTARALAPLPVEALRLPDDAAALLRRLGLIRIGQIAQIDRAALAHRFSGRPDAADALLARLDQMLGRKGDPFAPAEPPPRYLARLACPEPLLTCEGVAAGLDRLLADLETQLCAHGRGARRLQLSAFRSDGSSTSVEITVTQPARERTHLARLFSEVLPGLDPGFGVDLLTLEAHGCAPMEGAARPLGADFRTGAADAARLAELVDRILARLGGDSVRRLDGEDSHDPRRADREIPFAARRPAPASAPSPAVGARPLRVLDPPEPVEVIAGLPDGPPRRFVWRRAPRRVARASGPERIAPEWWRTLAHPGAGASALRARDYFEVEDGEGRRYWLYRDGLYPDGTGGEAGPAPRWYVHGLFP